MRPRNYLSWSSLDLFERSKERWTELYVHNEEIKWNKKGAAGIELGRSMAEALEFGGLTGDPVLDLTVANVPRFEVMEYELTSELKRGRGEEPITLLSKLDSAKSDLSAFKEYKQGVNPWTKDKVNKSGQITFYATSIYLKTGKIPEDIELVWVPSERGFDGKNHLKGEMVRFRTSRNMTDVLNMMVRMKKAWIEMEAVTERALL